MIERLLIGSDILMTQEREQARGRRWLFDLLHRPLCTATGLEPQSFCTNERQPRAFSRAHFFALSNLTPAPFWFDLDSITPDSVQYLSAYLYPSDLFIGYELSAQTRALFDRLSIAWIDIRLHPIRFLDDILFAFSASSPAVYDALSSFHVADAVFDLYADRLRAQQNEAQGRAAFSLRPGSALFIGQTMDDKTLCDHGHRRSLLDEREAFAKAGQTYGHIYYSRHPSQRAGDEDVLAYVQSCGFAERIEAPIHTLLASGRFAKVLALSSPLIFEARHFGLNATFLFQPPLTYGTRFGTDHLSIYQEFVSPHFWTQVLAPLMPTQASPRLMYFSGKDKLRDMLNACRPHAPIDKPEDILRRPPAVTQPHSMAASSRLEPFYQDGDPALSAPLRSLIAARAQNNLPGAFTDGTPEGLGYCLAGPLFLSLTKWIIERARHDKIETLYFLSRGGAILKQCYELLAPLYPQAPQAVTLHASRRGLRVPLIRTEADILAHLTFTQIPHALNKFFLVNFGLEDLPLETIQHFGFTSADTMVSPLRDLERLQNLALALAPFILERAANEREALLTYFGDKGLLDSKLKAVVSLAHHTTLQDAIITLSDNVNLGGYYFALQQEETGAQTASFLPRTIDTLSRKSHILFKFLFLDGEGPFLYATTENGKPKALLGAPADESLHLFAHKLHAGALRFIEDLIAVAGTALALAPFPAEAASDAYAAMLRAPAPADAALFESLSLRGGAIIALTPDDERTSIEDSLWAEGARALFAAQTETLNVDR